MVDLVPVYNALASFIAHHHRSQYVGFALVVFLRETDLLGWQEPEKVAHFRSQRANARHNAFER